jgi:hypothetical protein
LDGTAEFGQGVTWPGTMVLVLVLVLVLVFHKRSPPPARERYHVGDR